MVIMPLEIKGAFIIFPDLIEDDRGFFSCLWNQKEIEEAGLNSKIVQCNISFNDEMGTLRGMHYQDAPHSEVKTVRCTRGAIHDIILDLRPESSTFKKWIFNRLTEWGRHTLYIPEGVAHGYQTLIPDTEVLYSVSEYYHPESAKTIKWNDPQYGIEWPLPPTRMSEKDR